MHLIQKRRQRRPTKIGTRLLGSKMPVPISRSRTVESQTYSLTKWLDLVALASSPDLAEDQASAGKVPQVVSGEQKSHSVHEDVTKGPCTSTLQRAIFGSVARGSSSVL